MVSKVQLYVLTLILAPLTCCVELDLIDCGIDNTLEVTQGTVEMKQYPWLGILYYHYFSETGETRAVTTVALIHQQFVVGNAADIDPMPKINFRKKSRVLLGERWTDAIGRRVRNYVIHPEYGETQNTLALVQLQNPVKDPNIKPLCPPPEILRAPVFYVIKFNESYDVLQKQVIPVTNIPSGLCKDFYVKANLYSKNMRPPHVVCAVSLDEDRPCVWDAGAALVAKDVWGRWLLLGVGVRGPGCGAPARFLDMSSYAGWVKQSLARFERITISKISKKKYVLRSSGSGVGTSGSTAFGAYQKFGACDPEEKTNIIYREFIHLRTDNQMYQFLTYNKTPDETGDQLVINKMRVVSKIEFVRTAGCLSQRLLDIILYRGGFVMTIREDVEYTCLTMELVNSSAVSEMKIMHSCTRKSFGPPCYAYDSSLFMVSVFIQYSDTCSFEMYAWGFKKSMELLDIQEHKWEEGAHYEDFSMARHDYRGQKYMTDFGFEPLDQKMWVPEYDIWTSTNNLTILGTSETPPPRYSGAEPSTEVFVLIETTTPPSTAPTTPRTKRTFKRKTTTVNTTTTPTTTKPGWWGR